MLEPKNRERLQTLQTQLLIQQHLYKHVKQTKSTASKPNHYLSKLTTKLLKIRKHIHLKPVNQLAYSY